MNQTPFVDRIIIQPVSAERLAYIARQDRELKQRTTIERLIERIHNAAPLQAGAHAKH